MVEKIGLTRDEQVARNFLLGLIKEMVKRIANHDPAGREDLFRLAENVIPDFKATLAEDSPIREELDALSGEIITLARRTRPGRKVVGRGDGRGPNNPSRVADDQAPRGKKD